MRLYRLTILKEGQVKIDRIVSVREGRKLIEEHADLSRVCIYFHRKPQKLRIDCPDEVTVEYRQLSP